MKTLLFALLLVQSQPPPCSSAHLDINTATKAELLKLEGVTPELADALIKNRPYKVLSDVRWLMGIETREKVMPKLCLEKENAPVSPPVRKKAIQIAR